jgi:hypothetical protein
MPEAFSTSTPEAQHVRPRFVPGRSSMGNPHAPPPPYSPQRGVRTAGSWLTFCMVPAYAYWNVSVCESKISTLRPLRSPCGKAKEIKIE